MTIWTTRSRSDGPWPLELGRLVGHQSHSLGIIDSDFEKQMIAGTPLGRLSQPDDVARVAVFLASADSAWLTGEKITTSGGFR